MSEVLKISESGAWDFDIAESGEWNFVLTEQGSNPLPTTVTVGGGTLTDNELRIYFDKAINLLVPPVEEDFTTTFSGGAVTVRSLMLYEEGGEYFVDLILSRVIAAGETGTVAYSGTALIGENGYTVAAFTKSVTNNV